MASSTIQRRDRAETVATCRRLSRLALLVAIAVAVGVVLSGTAAAQSTDTPGVVGNETEDGKVAVQKSGGAFYVYDKTASGVAKTKVPYTGAGPDKAAKVSNRSDSGRSKRDSAKAQSAGLWAESRNDTTAADVHHKPTAVGELPKQPVECAMSAHKPYRPTPTAAKSAP